MHNSNKIAPLLPFYLPLHNSLTLSFFSIGAIPRGNLLTNSQEERDHIISVQGLITGVVQKVVKIKYNC